MDANPIEIYQTPDGTTQVEVQFGEDSVWLSQQQMASLFGQTKQNISLHVKNCFRESELEKKATVKEYLTVQTEGKREVSRTIEYYNLDVIISVGYRVKSQHGTKFRQWATQRLKDYLVQGYAINEKRLADKQIQIETLRTGIRILSRAIEEQAGTIHSNALAVFAEGLALLDDYDHEALDTQGKTLTEAVLPTVADYLDVVNAMQSDFASGVFARPKDHSFESSVAQIGQSFSGQSLYESIEGKAAMLLYLIVKNHGFIDGNKRIGAACFLYFLEQNGQLFTGDGQPIISNEALAALTLFIASSKPEEMETVKKLIISILNRKK